jgi:hypothetical protein
VPIPCTHSAADPTEQTGTIVRLVDLPARAPEWAQPLADALFEAGFEAGEEIRGGMAGYSVALSRDDCSVILGGDRGDFDATLSFPNPLKGRGHPRVRSVPVEDYVAAVRGDTDASFLLRDAGERHRQVAMWLIARVADRHPLELHENLVRRINALQRERAKALFG